MCSKGAESRFTALAGDLPKVEQTDDIADKSMRSEEAGFYGAAFLDKERDMVVLITCGKSLCSSSGMLDRLAAIAHRRMRDLTSAQGTSR